MKFLIVNAVYLPDNLGGGTIVCRNISDMLKNNGHTVKIFCGHSNSSPPLSVNVRTVDGIEVFSYNVHNSNEPSSKTHYRNIEVEEIFRQFLHKFRPDLVHFHSLQSLGAGLISIAKEYGSKAVLTVHDYWWVCPYQFLAVPLKGLCGKDGFDYVFDERCDCLDKSFLNERKQYLRLAAQKADLVLAVSKNMEDFLKRIGIRADLIRVCENGVAPPKKTYNRRFSGSLRVGYVGTTSYIKGYPTIEQMVTSLNLADGVRLLLYCTSNDLRNEFFKYLILKQEKLKNLLKKALNYFFRANYRLYINNPIVKYLPPFNQNELDRIYGTMDILILPSLIESFSLTTREALIRGVPVIAANSKGPAEIIVDGVNGFIVPTGDMTSLREKILLCAKDRRLLARLKDGARQTIITTLQQQKDELFKIYEELLGAKL